MTRALNQYLKQNPQSNEVVVAFAKRKWMTFYALQKEFGVEDESYIRSIIKSLLWLGCIVSSSEEEIEAYRWINNPELWAEYAAIHLLESGIDFLRKEIIGNEGKFSGGFVISTAFYIEDQEKKNARRRKQLAELEKQHETSK